MGVGKRRFAFASVALTILLGAVAFCGPAFALDPASLSITSATTSEALCPRILNGTDLAKVSDVLRAVPILRDYIIEMVHDPDVSIDVQKLLKKVLVDGKVTVIEFTKEFKKKWELSIRTSAISLRDISTPKTWDYTSAKPVSNQTGPPMDFGAPEGYESIAVGNRFTTKSISDIGSLFHELAHSRFQIFLTRNYLRICAKLPDIYTAAFADNPCSLNGQLLDFMHERYAYETEAKIMQSANCKYLGICEGAFTSNLREASAEQIRHAAGDFVIKHYGYTNPQVIALAHVPLYEIFRGGLAVDEVNSAFHVAYLEPVEFTPPAKDLPVALAILRYVRRAEGVTVSELADLSKIKIAIQALAETPAGAERLGEMLSRLSLAYGRTPKSRLALLEILNNPDIDSILKTKVFLNKETPK